MPSPYALVVDHDALPYLSSAILDDKWFEEFGWPSSGSPVRRILKGGIVYLLSDQADIGSKYLVIRVGNSGVLSKSESPQHVLDRIVHVATSIFDRTVAIPVQWKSYNDGSKLSIYAQNWEIGKGQRLYFERNPRNENNNLFVYNVTSGPEQISEVPSEIDVYDRVIAQLVDALIERSSSVPASQDTDSFGITLAAPFSASFVDASGLENWYNKKLTRQQRDFVDRPLDGPVRLKGAAGTGKTLSMAIKCLREAYRAEDRGEKVRIGFVTHSASVAHETVTGMFDALDPKRRWRHLKHASIWLGSLYELAQELLQYKEKRLEPLSTDGREGREYQLIALREVIQRLRRNSATYHQLLKDCSEEFRAALGSALETNRFAYELMNEIACILVAENISKGTEAATKYIVRPRERWQMALPAPADREAVVEIYDGYKAQLFESGMMSMDQMVTDLYRYLNFHEWNSLRQEKGFDLIFVDELHFFNRVERMIFKELFKTDYERTALKPPLFMSYDLKQSMNDAFLGYREGETPRTFFDQLGTGGTDLVELTDVFRYTPEIAAFLGDLDTAYPAEGFGEEWGAYGGTSQVPAGSVPSLKRYNTVSEMLDAVFQAAKRDAQRVGGKNVAVLSLNEDMFASYLKAGRIVDYYVSLTSRDQISELKHAGRRCVFSMPEYVAGLQFESVYLINVDRADLGEDGNIGEKRRFVSKLYTGAARAIRNLQIATIEERGGPAAVLAGPLLQGTLEGT